MAEKQSLNQKIEKLDGQVEWFYSDEFKLWINGINFIHKNKRVIIGLINKRNKINN